MIKGSENGQRRIHPTQKPIALAEWCFIELDKEGRSVVDLFGGSGSTMIACEKMNRKCYMMEIDPAYCDVIVERYRNLFPEKEICLMKM
jgi:DNA modification methylase